MSREIKKTRSQLEFEIAQKDKIIEELKVEAEIAKHNSITALDVSASLYEMIILGSGGE